MALIDAALAERPGEPRLRGACPPCDLRLSGVRVELLDLRALEQIAGERDHSVETKAA